MYTVFALSMIALVVSSFGKKLDLDSKDYYAQELVFQNQIDKSNRARALASSVKWEVAKGNIIISYPKQFAGSELSGNVNLFKPSDNNADVNFQINTDEQLKQEISTTTLSKGMYKIRIDWAVGKETFFNEGSIVIH